MSTYGDQRTITDAQNLALRRLCAALRCALGAPEWSRDAATGHKHVDAAIEEVEKAERAVANSAGEGGS